jgi:MFS family permease
MGARRTFAALRYPNYRLWFFGQLVSLLGTWMQSSAQQYWILEITDRTSYLGYTVFASGAATWIFMLWGGVAADRVPRRAMIIVTQSLSMLLAFILSALAFAGTVKPWHIITLAFCLGVVNAFDAPARQAFVLEMVEPKALTNAIALNSTMFNMAVAVGPAAGGMIYKLVGPAWCFAINGLSFLAVIAALLSMRLGPRRAPAASSSAWKDAWEGIRAVARDRRIVAIVCLIAVVSLFGMSFATLIPAWARNTLGGDSLTNGLLQSARGIGAVCAALMIATFVGVGVRGRVLTAASLVFPLMILVFSLTRSLSWSIVVLVGVGAANITVNNLCNSLVQTMCPEALRGRIIGIYTLFFFGFLPIGGLLAGTIAEKIGEPLAVAASAVMTLACAAGIALAVPSLRKQE